MKKIAVIVVLLIIFINSFDENGNRKRSSVTVPAGSVNYKAQKQDRLRERSLCESGGGFFHGRGNCEYDNYTILNEEIITHD